VTGADDGHVPHAVPGAGDFVAPEPPQQFAPALPVPLAPEPPAGKARTVVLTALAVLTVVLLAVGAGVFLTLRQGAPSAPVTAGPSSTGSTPAMTPTPTRSAGPFQGDLRTLLLSVPASATKTTGPGSLNSDDGSISIGMAAATGTDSGALLKWLEYLGYQQGAIREWLESDGTWVGVILNQLGSSNDARIWTTDVQKTFRSNSEFPTSLPIDGVPAGLVFPRSSISMNDRWFTEAVFSKGDIGVEVFVTGPIHSGPERTVAIAQAQYAHLP
jgi:hypothetical protein